MKAILVGLISLSLFRNTANASSFFFGEDVMTGPTGIHYQTTPKLLKRTVDRENGKIMEEVVIKSYQGPFEEVQIVLKVSGQTFEIETQGASYSGRGVFYGRPWDWNGWASEIEMPDGSSARTLDYLDDNGLVAVSEYSDPSGVLVSVTNTKMHLIDEKTYNTLKQKMLD